MFMDVYAKQLGLKVKKIRKFFLHIKKRFSTFRRTLLPPLDSPPLSSPICPIEEARVVVDKVLFKMDLTKFLAKHLKDL